MKVGYPVTGSFARIFNVNLALFFGYNNATKLKARNKSWVSSFFINNVRKRCVRPHKTGVRDHNIMKIVGQVMYKTRK